MRINSKENLKWVRGNDVLLKVTLLEPLKDSNTGEAVKDRKGNIQWIPFNLDGCSDIVASLALMQSSGNSKNSKNCNCCQEDATAKDYYSIVSKRGTEQGILILDIPSTLPLGSYSLSIIGHMNDRSFRVYEENLFEIVESNGRANVTFDVINGERSTDLDVKIQLMSTAVTGGKNAYELWRELPGNENKTLQEYLDGIVAGEVFQSDWNETNANSSAYIKNKPNVYTKSEVDTRINNVAASAGYQKPSTGIPASDLSSSVQASLNKANSAIQSLSGYTASDIGALSANTKFQSGNSYVTASGNKVTFKTINGEPIVGSGDITVEGGTTVTSGGKLYYMYNNRGTYSLYDETGQAPTFNALTASNDYCGYLTFNDKMYRLSTMTSNLLKYEYLNLDMETRMLTKETFTVTKTNGVNVDYTISYTTYGIEIPLMTFDSDTQTLNINGQGEGSSTVTGYYTVTIITTAGASFTDPVVSEGSTFTTTVPAGTSLALRLTIGTGYHMSSLLVNGANKTADIANSIYRLNNITEDTTVRFNCEVDTTVGEVFTLAINPGTGGTVTYRNGAVQEITEFTRLNVYGGDSFIITAVFDDGYLFDSISVSGNYDSRVDNHNMTTITGVRGNINVTVNFTVDSSYIDPSAFANNYNINAVNLGLPSGILWGDRNLGAISVTDEGGYYGWGDPTGEETSANNNKYAPNNTETCISMTGYDIVHAKLGGCWRLPTFEDYVELYMHTQRSFSEGYGDKGYGAWIIEGNNNSIAIIRAGYKVASSNNVYYAGDDIWQWTGDAIDSTVATDVHMKGACTSNLRYDVVRYLLLGGRSQKAAHISVRPVWDPNYVSRANKPVVNANDKEYVDLGLYHGRLWATMNVGASAPEEYGNYYAWGETSTKASYNFGSYAYKTEGSTDQNVSASYQSIGSNISGTEYDVAHLTWGGDWRMPNSDAVAELIRECTWTIAEINGVRGNTVTGPNGRSIFIPYSGMRNGETLWWAGKQSRMWSGTLGWSKPHNVNGWAVLSSETEVETPYGDNQLLFMGQYYRSLGYTIRPVIGREAGILPVYVSMPDEDEAIDLGLTSGTLWAQRDLGGDRYYSWGEIEPKDFYSFYNYEHRVADAASSSSDGSYVNLGNDIVGTAYDPVTEKWGNGWAMPTVAQMQELIDECEWTTSNNGMVVVTGRNGNSITLNIGYMKGWQTINDTNSSEVAYWTSSREYYEAAGSNIVYLNAKAMCLRTSANYNANSVPDPEITSEYKFYGMRIRPVKASDS